jgi:hypothetical protein
MEWIEKKIPRTLSCTWCCHARSKSQSGIDSCGADLAVPGDHIDTPCFEGVEEFQDCGESGSEQETAARFGATRGYAPIRRAGAGTAERAGRGGVAEI